MVLSMIPWFYGSLVSLILRDGDYHFSETFPVLCVKQFIKIRWVYLETISIMSLISKTARVSKDGIKTIGAVVARRSLVLGLVRDRPRLDTGNDAAW